MTERTAALLDLRDQSQFVRELFEGDDSEVAEWVEQVWLASLAAVRIHESQRTVVA